MPPLKAFFPGVRFSSRVRRSFPPPLIYNPLCRFSSSSFSRGNLIDTRAGAAKKCSREGEGGGGKIPSLACGESPAKRAPKKVRARGEGERPHFLPQKSCGADDESGSRGKGRFSTFFLQKGVDDAGGFKDVLKRLLLLFFVW